MKHYQTDKIRPENYIKNVQISRVLDDTYVLTYAKGRNKKKIPITKDTTAEIENQLQLQVQEGLKSIDMLHSEQTSAMRLVSKGLLINATGFFLATFAMLNEADPKVVLGMFGITLSSSIPILLGMMKTEPSKNIELLTYKKIQTELPLANEFFMTFPNAYQYLNGETEEKKRFRDKYLKSIIEEGRKPISFLELETKKGATKEEIDNLFIGAMLNNCPVPRGTKEVKQLIR